MAGANPFRGSDPGLSGISGNPLASGEWSVGTDFPNAVRYFYIGSAGSVTILRASDGVAVTFPNLQAGSYLFAGARQLSATTIVSPTANIIPHE